MVGQKGHVVYSFAGTAVTQNEYFLCSLPFSCMHNLSGLKL